MIQVRNNKDVNLKSVLLSLLFIFGLLFTMASCQNLGAQRAINSYDIRSEIVYSDDYSIESQVMKIVHSANRTKSMTNVAAQANL
ncbi:hypothetical protein A9Q84_03975 [Halobacteriovorax marinus]|uniref:Lipoprotein n=1 Tax=Halobacteriovorax marinus TaxID=97084 RepID=A0A1Y5FA63_9BACT|nr:hypothetical protein A9Q84_03975 [Halobacteriovorax marinus]